MACLELADMDQQAFLMDGIPPNYLPVDFSSINGWKEDDLADSLHCFMQSARRMVQQPYSTKSAGFASSLLVKTAKIALDKFPVPCSISCSAAREFFENNFIPLKLVGKGTGFVTGYFEPVVTASRQRTDRFRYPLYGRPDDLIDVDDKNRPETMDPYFKFGLVNAGQVTPYMDRAAINRGGLAGKNLELYWLEDPVEIFFIHIQGSARLQLTDGTMAFVSYAAKTGHQFSAIGKILVDQGELSLETVTMTSIKSWLWDNPDRAIKLMEKNQSYIFFKDLVLDNPDLGPVGAAGVQLTQTRSLAIDHQLHTFGTPIFVKSKLEIDGKTNAWSNLMIAQDTGSAIVGPQRGDLFIGSGNEAGEFAGQVKAEAEFTFLMPIPDGLPAS